MNGSQMSKQASEVHHYVVKVRTAEKELAAREIFDKIHPEGILPNLEKKLYSISALNHMNGFIIVSVEDRETLDRLITELIPSVYSKAIVGRLSQQEYETYSDPDKFEGLSA